MDEGEGVDVVIPQRELVDPGLEGVLPVPVDDHVLRKVLDAEPFLRIGRQRLGGIAVQFGEPPLHPDTEFAGHGRRVGVLLVRQQGHDEQRQGDGKDRHPRPQPYAEFSTHGDKARPG